ncbi:MAG TPA: ABC transporter permease [Candidatus Gallacutalibacter stercoravium]|nr:ABC transporter permease [Candidatus Gallacutalibacter stercoravium]
MKAFFYGVALQWRLDIRSKTMLITCYLVPLLFFALMGGIFTSLMPQAGDTLIQSMTVMGVSMGALIGLPPSLNEVYSGESKRVYQVNGAPVCFGLAAMALSSFCHLLLMCAVIYFAAPLAFGAALPENPAAYFGALVVFIAVSLAVSGVLGVAVKNQAKLTMGSQILFLPSILLSGVFFPVELLPDALEKLGAFFPAYWGYRLLADGGLCLANLWPLGLCLLLAIGLCGLFLKK